MIHRGGGYVMYTLYTSRKRHKNRNIKAQNMTNIFRHYNLTINISRSTRIQFLISGDQKSPLLLRLVHFLSPGRVSIHFNQNVPDCKYLSSEVNASEPPIQDLRARKTSPDRAKYRDATAGTGQAQCSAPSSQRFAHLPIVA
jgi:hypothetical protein